MKKALYTKQISRRCLADPELGTSYKERLKLTKVKVLCGEFKTKDCKNGYSKIIVK